MFDILARGFLLGDMRAFIIHLLGGITRDEQLAMLKEHLATETDMLRRLEILAARAGVF